MVITGDHVNQGKIGKTSAKNWNHQSEQFTDQLGKLVRGQGNQKGDQLLIAQEKKDMATAGTHIR